MAMWVLAYVFAQIRTSAPTTGEPRMRITPYDSLSNFVGEHFYQYVGQTLYLPKERSKEMSGYSRFNTRNTTGSYYKRRSGYSDTGYDAVVGKYYDVLDIEQNKYGTVFLKIREQRSRDIIYYEYDPRDVRFFPFITVGYFEKQKRLLIGNIYPMSKQYLKLNNVTDLNNYPITIDYAVAYNTPRDANNYDEWKCEDFLIEEDFFWKEIVIMQNVKNSAERIKIEYKNLDTYVKVALEIDSKMKDYNKAVETYGTLRVGISEEGCRALLGSPEHINTTRTAYGASEQWVYKERYIYVENGKVTAIQEKK